MGKDASLGKVIAEDEGLKFEKKTFEEVAAFCAELKPGCLEKKSWMGVDGNTVVHDIAHVVNPLTGSMNFLEGPVVRVRDMLESRVSEYVDLLRGVRAGQLDCAWCVSF